MRFAISVEDNNGLESVVSHHFGRCPFFVLVDMEDDDIKEVQVIDNPHYVQHQVGMVPEFINSLSANVMISGGMGRRAIAFFEEYGIAAATGASGNVSTTLKAYMNGSLSVAQPCRESVEHQHGHGHHHNHGEHDQ